MAIDKTKAMIQFLKNCTIIQNNPLFFNLGEVVDGAYQTSTQSDDIELNEPYIDGSVLCQYTLIIDCFRTISNNPVIICEDLIDKNVEDFADIQSLLDWINDCGKNREFPNFGDNCIIEEMQTTTHKPQLVRVDTSASPHMAVYRITIKITYIDTTDAVFS